MSGARPICAQCGKRYGRRWQAGQPMPEWLAPYNPFCTLRCALAYARRAHAAIKHRLVPAARR